MSSQTAINFGRAVDVGAVLGVVGLLAARRLSVHVAVTLTDSLVANLFGYEQFADDGKQSATEDLMDD
jgi:hypothetical protein